MLRWPLFALLMLLGCCVVAKAQTTGCHPLHIGDVLVVPHGYLIQSRNEFVRHEDAIRPSGDDRFWICRSQRGGWALYAPKTEQEDDA